MPRPGNEGGYGSPGNAAPGGSGGTPAPVLSTTNAAGVASTFVRTDDQLAIFDATVPVTQASSDAAATGTAAIAARRDHRHGMPALGTGAVTRVGGNTTEATTTSTTAVDLLSIAALSVTAATPIEFIVSGRKTTGAANRGGLGLKLNTTVIGEASATADNIYRQSTTNQAENGAAQGLIQPRVTGYLRAATGQYSDYGAGAIVTAIANANETADSPTVNITDFVIRGIIADALITLGADELQLYSLSTS